MVIVIHTFSGQEANIKKNPEQLIEREGVKDKFDRQILIRKELCRRSCVVKRHTSVQNQFPAYIIIEMELDELTQHLVTTIQGHPFCRTSRQNKVPVPLRRARSIASRDPS